MAHRNPNEDRATTKREPSYGSAKFMVCALVAIGLSFGFSSYRDQCVSDGESQCSTGSCTNIRVEGSLLKSEFDFASNLRMTLEKPTREVEFVSFRQADAETVTDRQPRELIFLEDRNQALTLNRVSNSVTLVDLESGSILSELVLGEHVNSLDRIADTNEFLALSTWTGDLHRFRLDEQQLEPTATLHLGRYPFDLTINAAGDRAFVSRQAADDVVEIELSTMKVLRTIPAGPKPATIILNATEDRVAVALLGERGLTQIDLKSEERVHTDRFVGLNIGQFTLANDGQSVYFPWMVYRRQPVSDSNIQAGWVLASRLARFRMNEKERREAISLDPPGDAIADPWGIALSPDEKFIYMTSSGTHELVRLTIDALPFEQRGGTDHIEPALLESNDDFVRLELGGRPMDIKLSASGNVAYVANSLNRSIQIVDLDTNKIEREIVIGKQQGLTSQERGERIFFDADRSLDGWYSCHSCHIEGGSNSTNMDTFNDGSRSTYKTVLPLFNLGETSPWTWHGWQTDLDAAMHKSLTDTMRGPEPTSQDVQDLKNYLVTMKSPPNPNQEPDPVVIYLANSNEDLEEEWTAQIERGRSLFQGSVAGCAECHSGPLYTDGEIHDVGLGSREDRYDGFNTPSLINTSQKMIWLHDGRASSLEQVLEKHHRPEELAGERELTSEELIDLIEYLKTI